MRLKHDSIKRNLLRVLLGIFDKRSTVYNNQIEPRMVSSSNLLAAIDSNVKNLQERAHVWDTFQLHVSAWNDQLSTTDRKLDIISKQVPMMLCNKCERCMRVLFPISEIR